VHGETHDDQTRGALVDATLDRVHEIGRLPAVLEQQVDGVLNGAQPV
jgi:hypothetical protein